MKAEKALQYRRVKLLSEYLGFDFLLMKKPQQCYVRIPETILLDKNGAPKDWVFNSGKLPQHPILKKRKENNTPLIVLKQLCSKHVPPAVLSPLKSIAEVVQVVKRILEEQKDAQFQIKKKNIEIQSVEGDVLSVNIIEFLQIVAENKLADNAFYEKWRMIQERVIQSKLDECFVVDSVRKNHIIESKCGKFISLGTANKVSVDALNSDDCAQNQTVRPLLVTDTKEMEAYKFFDSFLNKKLFSAAQDLIQFLERNYKCIVESIKTKFVLGSNREPYLVAVMDLYIKPATKLFEMREFQQWMSGGAIKLEQYLNCLHLYLIEHPSKPQPNLNQPINQQKGHKCRGDFCDSEVLSIPHFPQPKAQFPSIGLYNTRKMSYNLVESVRKRKGRVVERLKQNNILPSTYHIGDCESSEYEDTDEERDANVKVCQKCFTFYLNVMKFFEMDGFSNIIEKKSVANRLRASDSGSRRPGSTDFEESGLERHKKHLKSMRTLQRIETVASSSQKDKAPSPKLRRAKSQSGKLQPIHESLSKESNSKTPKKKEQETKKDNSKKQSDKITNVVKSKLIAAKLKNAYDSNGKSAANKAGPSPIKKPSKPSNFMMAAEQLVEKLQILPHGNEEEFLYSCKQYYKDNLPQAVDRVTFSSEPLPALYDFINNSPLVTAPANRIKRRPEMSLKRLSQLTGYPEVVSRSAFIFDTLICDEKTTIPFCVISSKMIHNSNNPAKPYQNIIVIHDIFDSYIEMIATAKELLQECSNSRFILFNYPGQSHTIYQEGQLLRPTHLATIIDKLLYRLSSHPQQMAVIGKQDTLKFVGIGLGGFLTASLLSTCPVLQGLVEGVMMVNAPYHCTAKIREVYNSLLQLFALEDKINEENAFLIYSKAIGQALTGQDLETKAGLNAIRPKGRQYLMRSMLKYWQEHPVEGFQHYQGKVSLVYGRDSILMQRQDMQLWTVKRDALRTELPLRVLVEVAGGHDLAYDNSDALVRYLSQFI